MTLAGCGEQGPVAVVARHVDVCPSIEQQFDDLVVARRDRLEQGRVTFSSLDIEIGPAVDQLLRNVSVPLRAARCRGVVPSTD